MPPDTHRVRAFQWEIVMGIKGKFKEILYIKDSPHRLALSFSIGVLIGTSPFLGLHTLIGIAVCVFYNFNKFPLFAGMFVTNPWTIIPIYTFSLWLGAVVTGVDLGDIRVDWMSLTFSTLLEDIRLVIVPYAVGTSIVSIVSAVVSYFVARSAVIKAQESRAALEAAGAGLPGEGE